MAKFRSILLIPFIGTLLAVSSIGSNLFSIAQDISISSGSIPSLTEDIGMAYYTGSDIEYKSIADNWVAPITVYSGNVDELEAILISNIVHIVFTTSGKMYHSFSQDNSTFTTPEEIDNGEDISLCYWDGTLILAYSKTLSATNSEIFIRRYMGAIWQSASQISNYAGESIHPYITTFGSNTLYIVWEDYRRGLANAFGRTTTDGTTFTDELILTDPNIIGAYPYICSSSGITYLITLSGQGVDIYPGDDISFTQRVVIMEGSFDYLSVDSDNTLLTIIAEKNGYLFAKMKNSDGWTANMNLGLGLEQDALSYVGKSYVAYKQGNDVIFAELEMGEIVESGAIPPSEDEFPEYVDAYPLEYQEIGSFFTGDPQETFIQIIDALPLPESIKKILRGTPWWMVIVLGVALISAFTITIIIWNKRRYGSVMENGNKVKLTNPFKRKKKNTKN